MNNDSETVREVCAEITDATMRVGAFFTPTIYGWRDRILAAHDREIAAKDAEIARLKAALKPVMEIDMSDETKFTQTQVTLAVSDAQRIMKEGDAAHNRVANAVRESEVNHE